MIVLGAFFWHQNSNDADGSSRSVLSKGAELVAEVKGKIAREDFVRSAGKLNDQETAFYGKIVDQDGGPVVGAKVVGGAQFNTMIASGVRNYKTYSNEVGPVLRPELMEIKLWRRDVKK